jgi:hypothetical protein
MIRILGVCCSYNLCNLYNLGFKYDISLLWKCLLLWAKMYGCWGNIGYATIPNLATRIPRSNEKHIQPSLQFVVTNDNCKCMVKLCNCIFSSTSQIIYRDFVRYILLNQSLYSTICFSYLAVYLYDKL